ncbi:hypothetical protein [Brevibacillus parabrevis]|uniref:hypothetical protein n=1 Tax=Brevibacillus parabrevis TaxID=54914 RepID=UPI0028D57CC7|nr:hypothetical protein [Brevibacillus parabrevis]MED1721941.1 hypothetical protein [Brevibacillus parabrevis]
MPSVENHPPDSISLAKQHLLRAIIQSKTKPYLPVWGELFTALRDIAKTGRQRRENIRLYLLQPTGSLWYLHKEDCFHADLPDPGISISLSQEQLIDALLKGSFSPKTPAS